MPLPIATHQRHGKMHGKAKIWTAQANRYRELARARLEHRQHYGDLLIAAIAANPSGGRDPLWTQKDLKIASGRATPEDIEVWAQDAKALAVDENRRVTAAWRKAWNEWMASSWSKSPSKVYAWCKTEKPAPILPTTDRGIGYLTPMESPRKRPGSGEDCGSPPLSRNPKPSRLRNYRVCPPSQVTSSGMWSSTFPEQKLRAWTHGPRTT